MHFLPWNTKMNKVQIRTNIKHFTYVNISCTLRWTSLIGNPFNSLQANQNLHKTINYFISNIISSINIWNCCKKKKVKQILTLTTVCHRLQKLS